MVRPDVLQSVIEATRQLFPGLVKVETSHDRHDPEYPYDVFTVLIVEPTGEIDQIVDRECEWIQRVANIVPGLGSFRLAIHPK